MWQQPLTERVQAAAENLFLRTVMSTALRCCRITAILALSTKFWLICSFIQEMHWLWHNTVTECDLWRGVIFRPSCNLLVFRSTAIHCAVDQCRRQTDANVVVGVEWMASSTRGVAFIFALRGTPRRAVLITCYSITSISNSIATMPTNDIGRRPL